MAVSRLIKVTPLEYAKNIAPMIYAVLCMAVVIILVKPFIAEVFLPIKIFSLILVGFVVYMTALFAIGRPIFMQLLSTATTVFSKVTP